MTPRSLPSIAILVLLASCAKSDLVRTAEQGDRARLESLVRERDRTGNLTNGEVVDLARAVVERELTTTKREIAAARIELTYACAREAEPILSRIARSHDEAGAKAAWLLVQTGARSPSSFDATLGDPLEGFRAVAARAMTDKDDAEGRRVALIDPSPLVRRAGIQAARDAGDLYDLPLLRDRARLDPSPMVRSEAIRALLHHPKERLEEIARFLPDADDTTRSELATAFATTRSGEGGVIELRRLLATAPMRMSSMLGAIFFVRGSHPDDPQTLELATGIVVENLRRSGRVQRMSAIRLAPLRSPFLEEIEAAARASDREVMLVAWSRLAEGPKHEREANEMLLRFAGNDYGRLSSEARLRLAEKGRRDIQAWIERDLDSPDPERHALAIRALAKLGRVARAARLLANPDANVRLKSACGILSESDSAAHKP